MDDVAIKAFRCGRCEASKEAKRLPMGWKQTAAGTVCKDCRKAAYVQRVVSLPAAEVVADTPTKPWEPFRRSWDLATDLTNWCQRELLRYDFTRTPEMTASPKFDAKMFPGGRDLYGHWNHECPFRRSFDGATGSAATIIRAVVSRWSGHKEFGRYAVLWRRSAASPTARWPQPWVVRAQDYRLEMIGDEPHVSMTVPGGRVQVRLANDSNWRRDVRRFIQVVRGAATGGDLKVAAKFRDGVLVGVMIRLSAMFERKAEGGEAVEAAGGPTPDNLLEIRLPGREPFVFCGDDLVGKQAAYDRWRHRAAVGLKHEKRWPKAKRDKMVLGNQQVAINAANRVKTAVEQLVAMVVGHECKRTGRLLPGYLMRNQVGTFAYDDSCKEFIRRFEWHTLREKLAQRCAEVGIRFVHATEVRATG